LYLFFFGLGYKNLYSKSVFICWKNYVKDEKRYILKFFIIQLGSTKTFYNIILELKDFDHEIYKVWVKYGVGLLNMDMKIKVSHLRGRRIEIE
jgi:tryptophan-rich sensory protein